MNCLGRVLIGVGDKKPILAEWEWSSCYSKLPMFSIETWRYLWFGPVEKFMASLVKIHLLCDLPALSKYPGKNWLHSMSPFTGVMNLFTGTHRTQENSH